LIVPVGDVLYELNERMHRLEIPGFTDIGQIYNDNVHLGIIGGYIAGLTTYATLYREDPHGLPSLDWGFNSPLLESQIQDVVWDVVSHHAFTDVPEPASAGAALLFAGSVVAARRRRSASRA